MALLLRFITTLPPGSGSLRIHPRIGAGFFHVFLSEELHSTTPFVQAAAQERSNEPASGARAKCIRSPIGWLDSLELIGMDLAWQWSGTHNRLSTCEHVGRAQIVPRSAYAPKSAIAPVL